MRCHLNNLARGFTLIEILVVVIIIGIAGALIVPQIGDHDDLKAAAAARVVMSDLIYAQNRAISTQQKHYVQFAAGTPQGYTVYSPISPATIIQHPIQHQDYIARFGTTAGLSQASLGQVDFGGQKTIAFDELGAPYSYDGTTVTALAAPGSIEVQSGKFKLTITVQPYTGEIGVH